MERNNTMNKRIQELIKQSKMSLWEPPDPTSLVSQITHPGNYAIFSDQFLEKFAELIVRECCDVLTENVEVALDASGSPVYPEGLIYEHFGVEE